MFVDCAKIYLKAGNGGDGCNSFERDQAGRIMRANGGPGGKGGDIIFKVDVNVRTLLDFQYRQHFTGQRGGHASSNNKKGAFGADCIIKVPEGTIVKDQRTGKILVDLVKEGESFVVARGGAGGSGNSKFRLAGKGEEGEEKTVLLELKIIADVGIVGFPNAGKSTLISRITKATPKIADYPFTTKEPVLGIASFGEREFAVADIPGLIEGAHAGKGLGDRFLRHIERTKVLIHLIDVSGISQRDPVKDYRQLNKELKLYSESLADKPQIIAANKMDVGETAKAAFKKLKTALKSKKIVPISAKSGLGLDKLLAETLKVLGKVSDEC